MRSQAKIPAISILIVSNDDALRHSKTPRKEAVRTFNFSVSFLQFCHKKLTIGRLAPKIALIVNISSQLQNWCPKVIWVFDTMLAVQPQQWLISIFVVMSSWRNVQSG